MNYQICRPAARYAVTMLVSLALYVVALVASLIWLKVGVEGPWKYAIAVLPVLPALGVPLAVIRFCRAMDELQLRIQLESLAFAFVSTAITTLTYGFLQNAGLPNLSWVWVWPVMTTCWIAGLLVARRRYR